jgi:hypothetical protein
VGRFFFSAWLAMFLSVANIALFVFVQGVQDVSIWRWTLLLIGWVVCSWFSFCALRSGQSKSWLSWDGNIWRVQNVYPNHNLALGGESIYALDVHLDLQKLLLISLHSEKGRRHWFWLSQDSFPDRWHGFRCAVYSRSEDLSS